MNNNKDPKTCKNSIDFAGIYICVLNQIPCCRCKVCPLDNNNGLDVSIRQDKDST